MPAIAAKPVVLSSGTSHIPFLLGDALHIPRQHSDYRPGRLSRRDAGSQTGTALWATGLALVCAGVLLILMAHICMRRRGISVGGLFAKLKRRLARETTQGECMDTEPKACVDGIATENAQPTCYANAPSSSEDEASSCESSCDMREVRRGATCSIQRCASQPYLSPRRCAPPSAPCESRRSDPECDSESTASQSARTPSTEDIPYSEDPFASAHDPELQSERAASPSVFTIRSSRMSLTPSTPGTLGGMDDSGYTSDATVSTVPPSYRTYRVSIPNLLDHPLPLPRPLPPLPGEVAPPPSAYTGRALGSRVPSSTMQRSLTDSRRPRRETRRGNGLPRKSVDGGVRLDGLELPPAYGVSDAGSSNSRE